MVEWYTPTRRYLIVFTQRGGSTFLAHCLDGHPDIGCERGEPLHPWHLWRKILGDQEGIYNILSLVLDRPGYKVTMARVNYRHWADVPRDFAQELDGILHLHRHNAFRIILSSIINTQQARVTHTYKRLEPMQIEIDTEQLLREMKRYIRNVKGTRKQIIRLGRPVLALRYDELVGGEGYEAEYIPGPEALRITEFLGVRPAVLQCRLKRTNPEPARELISNWREVRRAITNAGYGGYLDDETD